MTRTAHLIVAAIQPVLAGTAFDAAQGGGGSSYGRGASLIWCTGSVDFRARHPSAVEAFDDDHPGGCTDLSVYVDDAGLVDRAFIEVMSIDDGLVGLPIEDALPVLVQRISEVLGRDSVSSS